MTLEGVFKLVDRASPSLRGIERRADAADRALDKLGRTMDRIEAKSAASKLSGLSGDMGKLETATRRTEAATNSNNGTQKAYNRTLDDTSAKTRKVTSDTGAFERAMRKVLTVAGGLGVILGPGKLAIIAAAIQPIIGAISALGAGAVALVQQAGAATGALVPLIARMGDLAGAGVSAVTMFLSVKAATEVTKFALSGVSQAINGNAQAFKKLTPEAKAFVREMRNLQPILNTIRTSAQKGLFPGLTGAIKTARSNGAFQLAATGANQIGGAVGNVAQNAAQQLTNPTVLRDLSGISGTMADVIGRLGDAATNVAQAFINILAAAQPLTRWIAATIDQWSKYALQQVEIARGTGELGTYFGRTKTTLIDVGHTVRDFGMGFINIMRVARGESGNFGGSIEKIAKEFRDWTSDFGNQAKIALWFQRSQEDAHRFGDILLATLRIFQGLGKASMGLGTSMTSGIATTMDRWATWVNSFSGQNILTQWFDGMKTTLSAIWGLVSDIAGAFTSLGANGGGAANLIGEVRQMLPDLVKVIQSISANIGPGLFGTVQQLFHLFATMTSASGSPLGEILNLTDSILTTVNHILDAFTGVRVAAGIALTAIGGALLLRKLAGIVGGVNGITAAWQRVTGATVAATDAAMAYGGGGAAGGGGGAVASAATRDAYLAAQVKSGTMTSAEAAGLRTPTVGTPGFIGPMPEAIPAAGGVRGFLGRPAVGMGLGFGLPIAAGVGAQIAQSQGLIGSKRAGQVQNVASLAGTGAMLGMFAPEIGGPLIGAGIGAGAGLLMNALSGSSGPSTQQKYLNSLQAHAQAAGGFDITKSQGGAQTLQQANLYENVLDRSLTKLRTERAAAAKVGPTTHYESMGRFGGQQVTTTNKGQVEAYDKQIAALRKIRGENIERLGTERATLKAQEKQTDALREQSRIGTSKSIAYGIGKSEMEAYNVYRKGGMSAEDATTKVSQDALKRSKTLRAPGRQVLLSGIHEWLVEQAKLHPQLDSELGKYDKGMKAAMAAVGRTVSVSGKSVLQDTIPMWQKIAAAMQTPVQVALEANTTGFTALQQQARGVLIGLGYSGAKADSIIRTMESGGGGPNIMMPKTPAAPSFASLTASPAGFAGGGRIPGRGLQDTVPIAPGAIGAPGELVVNRHTEQKANSLLGAAGTSLAALVAGETKRHSDILPDQSALFAKGGRIGAALKEANRIAALRSTYQFGGGHSTPAPSTPPWDCSSSTSRVLQAAGYDIPTMVASQFMNWGQPGPGPIGVAASKGHVYMMLDGKPWGTSYSNYKGGPGWIHNGTGWRSGFTQRHAPNAGGGGARGVSGGGSNAFLPLMGALNYTGFGADGLGDFSLAASLRTGHIVAAGMQGKINSIIRKQRGAAGGGGAITGGGTSSQNETLARSMMLQSGWNASQWPSLQKLWTLESGFSSTAKNASSGAYGIPQALPASKMASAGSDYLTNPATQIKWGLGYIKGRYRTPDAAWTFENSHSPKWYAKGGRLPEWGGWHANGMDRTFDRPTMIGVGEKGRERVTVTPHGSGSGAGSITINAPITINGTDLSPQQLRGIIDQAFEDLARQIERQSTEAGA